MGQGTSARRLQLSEGVQLPVQGREGQCRVCLETGGDLIAPCQCRGTSKWIHRECLNRWRASRSNPKCLTNCCECGFTYVLDLHRIIQDEGAARRRRFARRIAAQGLASFLMVQAAIIFLGFLVRVFDPDQKLVKFFDFPQTAHGHDPQNFRDAFLYHKTTYYVAGLIAFLAILGVGGVVMGLVLACSNRNRGPSSRADIDICTGCDAYDMYFCSDCCHSCSYSCSQCLTPAHASRGIGSNGQCCDQCCHDCDCSQCNPGSGNGDSGGASVCAVIGMIALVIFVLIGVFIAAVLVVMAIQRAAQQYAKLQQVRVLATEYMVRDLADPADLGDATDSGITAADSAAHQQEMSAPQRDQQAFMVPDPEFQRRMQQMIHRDIHAIFEGPDPRQALRDEVSVPLGETSAIPTCQSMP